MEDFSRDLEKELTKYKKGANPFKKARTWQLLFISDDGRVLYVKKYKAVAMLLMIAAAVMVTALAGTTYYAYRLKRSTISLEQQLETVRDKIESAEKKMKSERAYFLAKYAEKGIDNPQKKEIDQQQPPPKEKGKEAEEETVLAAVAIEKFNLERRQSGLQLTFIVTNDQPEEGSVSGRIFVVLKQNENDTSTWITKPPVLLRDGKPSDYSRGKLFSINRFKNESFSLPSETAAGSFKTLTIYVYTEEGRLMVESSYPIPQPESPEEINKTGETENGAANDQTVGGDGPAAVKRELKPENRGA